MMRKIKSIIKLMRVHHYIKNLFLFVPLFFSGQLLDWPMVGKTLLGFCAFCLACSAVYTFNDIMDVESDRKHSVKCKRPIASGAVSVKSAAALAAVLLVLSMAVQVLAGMEAVSSWIYLGAYLVMNLAYSGRLKHIPLLDVAILAAGFLLRLAYGAALTGIALSDWLFLTVLTVSFYLGLGKRMGELLREKDETRQVMKSYNRGFLEKGMTMCLTLAIAFYSLWAAEGGKTGERTPGLIWTVPLVVLIALKYNMNLEGDSDGDPVEVILKDKVLCVLALLLAASVFVLLYIL